MDTRPQQLDDATRGGRSDVSASARDTASRSSRRREARVDEKVRLNLPGSYGDAYVRVFVERHVAHAVAPPPPARAADPPARGGLHNTISLWFSLDSPGARERPVQDRHAARLASSLPRRARGRGRAARRNASIERSWHVVPEAARDAGRAAERAAAGPGPEQRRRLRLAGGRLGAAPPLPRPRLGGRQLLRVRVGADARERAGGRALRRGRGPRTVREIVEVSREGRAPKNDPALFALALAAGRGDAATRKAALDALPQVCRTGTHLFQFATFVEGFRGWGRSLRRAVGRWYAAQSADALAYQAVKYRQREGVTHRDLLRLAHPARASAPATRRSTSRPSTLACSSGSSAAARPTVCRVWSRASFARSRRRRAAEAAALVREHGLPREALPPEHLTSPEVWEALLEDMPMTALDPQPRDDDPGRRARAGLGRHGQGRSRGWATRSGCGGRACTRSPCWRRSAPTRPAAAPAAGTRGTRCARSSTRSTPRSTRRSRTSSRPASGCCSRSTFRAR